MVEFCPGYPPPFDALVAVDDDTRRSGQSLAPVGAAYHVRRDALGRNLRRYEAVQADAWRLDRLEVAVGTGLDGDLRREALRPDHG